MAQNIHSSFSVGDIFLDSLRQHFECTSLTLVSLEDRLRLPVCEDPQLVRRYLYLYTLPVLEGARLLNGSMDECDVWATVSVCLSLNLRHLDYVLDADQSSESVPGDIRQAHSLLAGAHEILRIHGVEWGPAQSALYGQFLEYEMEVQQGYFHDLSSLWRRVSPMCVLPETYLAKYLSPGFLRQYRTFLSWSLLQSDCDHALKDMTRQCHTPVTKLLHERTAGVYHDFSVGAEVLDGIKHALQMISSSLRSEIRGYPLWHYIVTQMEEAFQH